MPKKPENRVENRVTAGDLIALAEAISKAINAENLDAVLESMRVEDRLWLTGAASTIGLSAVEASRRVRRGGLNG